MGEVRTIKAGEIQECVCRLFLKACIAPSPDAMRALERVMREEEGAAGEVMRQINENARIAVEEQIPCCQDTGMAVVFMDIGTDVHIEGDLNGAVEGGVKEAYKRGNFRMSVLDALTRVNTGDNTPAVLHTRLVPGSSVKITAAPKGFGSENMSRLAMLKPSDGIEGIADFVVTAAKEAGGSPCPPVILGVGIGGTMEYCAILAKRALLRTVGEFNPNPLAAGLEARLLSEVNALGLGPMGMGGKNYCLCVNIEVFPTHIAGLPVAVNFQCHAARHVSEVI